MKPRTLRRLSPGYWIRKWVAERALRRFMREEEARLGTAGQAIDFAIDNIGAGGWVNPVEFLEAWREGGDLSDWPAYRPQGVQGSGA